MKAFPIDVARMPGMKEWVAKVIEDHSLQESLDACKAGFAAGGIDIEQIRGLITTLDADFSLDDFDTVQLAAHDCSSVVVLQNLQHALTHLNPVPQADDYRILIFCVMLELKCLADPAAHSVFTSFSDLIKCTPLVQGGTAKKAFYNLSRLLHPDKFASLNSKLTTQLVTKIQQGLSALYSAPTANSNHAGGGAAAADDSARGGGAAAGSIPRRAANTSASSALVPHDERDDLEFYIPMAATGLESRSYANFDSETGQYTVSRNALTRYINDSTQKRQMAFTRNDAVKIIGQHSIRTPWLILTVQVPAGRIYFASEAQLAAGTKALNANGNRLFPILGPRTVVNIIKIELDCNKRQFRITSKDHTALRRYLEDFRFARGHNMPNFVTVYVNKEALQDNPEAGAPVLMDRAEAVELDLPALPCEVGAVEPALLALTDELSPVEVVRVSTNGTDATSSVVQELTDVVGPTTSLATSQSALFPNSLGRSAIHMGDEGSITVNLHPGNPPRTTDGVNLGCCGGGCSIS